MKLKTSEEWQKLCKVKVLDPDGWDRKNFQFSWHEELISRAEFERRLAPSTCRFPAGTLKRGELVNIWIDK